MYSGVARTERIGMRQSGDRKRWGTALKHPLIFRRDIKESGGHRAIPERIVGPA